MQRAGRTGWHGRTQPSQRSAGGVPLGDFLLLAYGVRLAQLVPRRMP